MLSFLFKQERVNYSQHKLITKFLAIYNKINPKGKKNTEAAKGLCKGLSLVYFQYSIEGRSEAFFEMLRKILQCSFETLPVNQQEEIKTFIAEVFLQQNAASLYPHHTECSDAVILASKDRSELHKKIKTMTTDIQSQYQSDVIIIATFAHIHQFVIDIKKNGSTYSYFVYDPNNDNMPTKLGSIDKLSGSITEILDRMNAGSGTTNISTADSDKSSLLDIYIYPEKNFNKYPLPDREMQDLLDLVRDMIASDKNNDCWHEFYFLIRKTIRHFQARYTAKNTALSSLYFVAESIEDLITLYKVNYPDISEEMISTLCKIKSTLSEKMKSHFYTLDYLTKNDSLYAQSFFNNDPCGNTTILHEAARMGGLAAVSFLCNQNLNPWLENNNELSPIQTAICSGNVLIIKYFSDFLNGFDADEKVFLTAFDTDYYFFIKSHRSDKPERLEKMLDSIAAIGQFIKNGQFDTDIDLNIKMEEEKKSDISGDTVTLTMPSLTDVAESENKHFNNTVTDISQYSALCFLSHDNTDPAGAEADTLEHIPPAFCKRT